ncbi:unnamed protein product [Bursaphelenchus okinawaensis]|uniref:Uncharacterized protein n=1 Tax=Bursaphelenchus okinawaensis TaxID=465554 RepID=A0A811KD44_9BILA|nr:unnamed protein product [Bursaphelenchus okinawaensis]CAG9099347.1 unnamed protein product [Bursaphelenchus okinawaensis]
MNYLAVLCKFLVFSWIGVHSKFYGVSDSLEAGSGEDDLFENLGFELPAHYRLERHLMKYYNNRILPRRKAAWSVKVKFRIALYQIVEVNEPQQYVILNSWIVESWKDDFLYWDPVKFENITEIILPAENLWTPDTTLYNSLLMDDAESRRIQSIKVTTLPHRHTAQIEFLYPTLYKFSCTLDLRLFPFDEQFCKLTFGSWTHDNKAIDYHPNNGTDAAIGVENCIENEEWNIIQTSVSRMERKYHCCPNNYTLLEFYILMQRKPLYYVTNLIAPTAIITFIAIIGFFSSATVNQIRDEKITLGITTLLSMSILIFMVSDKMPSTSSFVPLIGWFYTSMMLLISLGTWASAVVISVQKKGIMGKRPPMKTMRWARKLGSILQVEMPLLMKQAYALKAKRRTTFFTLFNSNVFGGAKKQSAEEKEQEKIMKQANANRRPSFFTRSWQKLSNSRSTTPITNSTLLPPPNSDSANSGLTRLASFQKSQQPTMELSTMSIDEGDEDLTLDEWDPSTPGPPTPTRLQPNGSVWPPTAPESPPRRSQSTVTAPIIRKGSKRPAIVPELSLDGNPMITTPQGNQRTLAEIEYDWLAEIVERVFLVIFIILFLFCAIGINFIGFYHWMRTQIIDTVDE